MQASVPALRWACLTVVLCALSVLAPAAAVNSSAATPPSLADLLAPYDSFKDMCSKLTELVPLPIVKPQELCATTGFTTATRMCGLINLMATGIDRPDSQQQGAQQLHWPPADTFGKHLAQW
jgi:hypothetical protein